MSYSYEISGFFFAKSLDYCADGGIVTCVVGSGQPADRLGEKEANMSKYTYAIFSNGREVENLEAGVFATAEEAEAAGNAALDDLCPQGSPYRAYYRVEVLPAD